MQIEEMVGGVKDAMNVKKVFGDPIERDGAMFVPAAVIRGGAGGGTGPKEEGGGAGFGMNARPIGAYVISGGKVRFRPAIDVNRVIMGGQIVAALALLTIRAIARARRPVVELRGRRLRRLRRLLAR